MQRSYSDWHALPGGIKVQFALKGTHFQATWDPAPPKNLGPCLAGYVKARDAFVSEWAKRMGQRIALLGPIGGSASLCLITYTPKGGITTEPINGVSRA